MSTIRDILPDGVGGLSAPVRALEDGWSLPASWYTDPAVLRREQQRIFSRSWLYAGRADQVAEPGCYVSVQAGDVPILVVRGQDGELRAFVNVCRHRGHLVVEQSGCRETLQCPYHAWTYNLDGTLRRAPRAEHEPDFDASRFSLLPASVGTWGPFVFVNPDAGAGPLADTLADLPGVIVGSGLVLDELRFHSHHESQFRGNWKVAMENYLECYHCPTAHPGFSKVIDVDPDEYGLHAEPTYLSQVGHVRAAVASGARDAPYEAQGEIEQAQYHVVFPNTTINISPGFQNLSIERWVPVGTTETLEVTDYYFGPDVPEGQIEEFLAFDTQVADEDVALVGSVQTGLESAMVPQGRLLRTSERLIGEFHRRLVSALDTRH